STSSGSSPAAAAISTIGRSWAAWAISRLESIPVLAVRSVRDRGGGQLGDESVGVEALEAEGRDQRRRLPRGDELGDGRPDDRRGLEAVRPPAARDEEAVHLGPPENRAVI